MLTLVESASQRTAESVNPLTSLEELDRRYLDAISAVFQSAFAELEAQDKLPSIALRIENNGEQRDITEHVVPVPTRLQPGERLVIGQDGGFYALRYLPDSTSIFDGVNHRPLSVAEVVMHKKSALDTMDRLRNAPPRKIK